jgi:UDP-glucose 4-epimerase
MAGISGTEAATGAVLMRVLVTGGAGFVGSHAVLALVDAGREAIIFDDLSQGHRGAVPPGVPLVAASLADAAAIESAFADHGPFDAVMHFAALSLVGESMQRPMRYLGENVANGTRLIDACLRHGVKKFVLSSTANLFGASARVPIDEDQPIEPGSPYGESKFMLERALLWAERTHGMRHACLRYFNAAGADALGRAGEHHDPETHLIPLVIDAALGRRPPLTVFGDDYPTEDGTCIRDYIHVADLADAHLRALDVLQTRSVTYNLGNGAGYSVRQVIATAETVLGRKVPHSIGPRRAGDPATLVAASGRLRAETGWTPNFPDLADIIRTAADWRLRHPHGYAAS